MTDRAGRTSRTTGATRGPSPVRENGPVPDMTSTTTSAATHGGAAAVAGPVPQADLTWGGTWPDLAVFTELALGHTRVIPVVRRVLADAETPVGVYRKLAKSEPGTFLLESAEHGGVWSRYSIVGARCAATLTERDGQAHWIGDPPVGLPQSGDPAAAVRDTVAALATPRIPGLPPLTGGLVGAISYDAVRRWERVPDEGRDELHLPELAMMLATDLAVFDHSDGSLLLVANAVNRDATDERIEEAWADAVARSRFHSRGDHGDQAGDLATVERQLLNALALQDGGDGGAGGGHQRRDVTRHGYRRGCGGGFQYRFNHGRLSGGKS